MSFLLSFITEWKSAYDSTDHYLLSTFITPVLYISYEELLDKNYDRIYSTLSFAVYWLDTFIGLLHVSVCMQCFCVCAIVY